LEGKFDLLDLPDWLFADGTFDNLRSVVDPDENLCLGSVWLSPMMLDWPSVAYQ